MIGSLRFVENLKQRGVADDILNGLCQRFSELNKFIADKAHSGLGPGFCVGHSYFVPDDNSTGFDFAWYKSVLETQIIPLLEEYWFDNDELVRSWRAKLSAEL